MYLTLVLAFFAFFIPYVGDILSKQSYISQQLHLSIHSIERRTRLRNCAIENWFISLHGKNSVEEEYVKNPIIKRQKTPIKTRILDSPESYIYINPNGPPEVGKINLNLVFDRAKISDSDDYYKLFCRLLHLTYSGKAASSEKVNSCIHAIMQSVYADNSFQEIKEPKDLLEILDPEIYSKERRTLSKIIHGASSNGKKSYPPLHLLITTNFLSGVRKKGLQKINVHYASGEVLLAVFNEFSLVKNILASREDVLQNGRIKRVRLLKDNILHKHSAAEKREISKICDFTLSKSQ